MFTLINRAHNIKIYYMIIMHINFRVIYSFFKSNRCENNNSQQVYKLSVNRNDYLWMYGVCKAPDEDE